MTRRPAFALGAALALLGSLLVLSGCFSSLPRAEFTADPRFAYPPLVVQFDASASSSPNGVIVAYAWDFGDGAESAGVTTTHTYPEKGIYTVALTVTDEAGKTDSRSMNVEALNRVPVALFVASVYSTPVRQPVRFDASDSYDPDGQIVEYLWDFGDGQVGEGVLVEHEYETANGSGWRPEITLTVVDDDRGEGIRKQSILVVGCDSCAGN